MNNLMRFIVENIDWKQQLQRDPYNLIIKEDPDLPDVYLFKYNQYESDMNNIICQEARGIILEVIGSNVKLLCHSFDKFFNYGEPQGIEVLKKIDLNHCTWQEKRDGSLLRIWYYKDRWRISTSGTIDANKASIDIPSCKHKSFGDMFRAIFTTYEEDLDVLDYTCTYSFEMTSPDNKIVVDYENSELTLIGIRDNQFNEELDPYIHNPFTSIKCAQTYDVSRISNALELINKMKNFEGLVLCDNHYNRVKIKTDEYLVLARLTDETSSDRGLLKLILEDKIDDVISSLPHLQRRVDLIKNFIKKEIQAINALYDEIDFTKERKEIALQLQGNRYQGFVFKKLSDPQYDFVSDYFNINNLEKIYKAYKEFTLEGSEI